MNVLNFDSRQCERIRRHLDAYLSNELLVETTSEILRHLETCEACARELETRTRVRDLVRRAATSQTPPEELRQAIQRRLRETQPGLWGGSRELNWAVALAGIVVIVLGGIVAHQWVRVVRGKRIVAGVLALGVSDHVQCAIKGHNYPEVANPPEVLRKKLGPQYAGLLDVVHQNLPGFEILEAHICSIPGSSRKYVHFITRGRGPILSVILTKNDGAHLPSGGAFRSVVAGHVNLYVAHEQGMNVAGFESRGYLGFVVSDLDTSTTLQIADQLAPPLNAALQAAG
ncbi:MAG: zf-HC2 domain-containing protein [Terriglobia bacterium]|jgi:anti-sigma factor (TIGR02949 family)